MRDRQDAVRHRYIIALRQHYSIAEICAFTKYSESTVKGWTVKDRTSAKARQVTDRAVELLRHTVPSDTLSSIGTITPEFKDFTDQN